MYKPTVFYGILSERTGAANDVCFNALLDVAAHCGAAGYRPLHLGYSRTDYARNEFAKAFLASTTRDNDLLVMLDCDHKHPNNIVSMFAENDPTLGVVGALAYRRGEPYDPLFFVRINGGLHSVTEFPDNEMFPCAIVSTSAIAIRRWVFLELQQRGCTSPWFRYEYPTDGSQPSEDMYFGRICEQSGIRHYCDSKIKIPHASVTFVDTEVHKAYMATRQDMLAPGTIEVVK